MNKESKLKKETSGNQTISIKECLNLIGIKELAANIYILPKTYKSIQTA